MFTPIFAILQVHRSLFILFENSKKASFQKFESVNSHLSNAGIHTDVFRLFLQNKIYFKRPVHGKSKDSQSPCVDSCGREGTETKEFVFFSSKSLNFAYIRAVDACISISTSGGILDNFI